MKFTDFICFEAVVPQLKATDRNGVIAELVCALEKAGQLENGESEKITRAIIKRENEASTGIGKGVAVPHVKHKAVKNTAGIVGCSSTGIDFSSLDKQPVYSVILLVSPADDPDKHLQAMGNIFKSLQQEKFRRFLRQSETTEQIEYLLKEIDEKTFL